MKFFSRIWQDIRQLDNVDLYLVLILAIVFIFFDVVGWTIPVSVESLILLTLGLLALSMVINRHRMNQLAESNTLERTMILAKEFDEIALVRDLNQSKELMIIGLNLTQTLSMQFPLLKTKLENGHDVKILLVDPSSPACRLAALRSTLGYDKLHIQNTIHVALKKCEELINMAADSRGSIEVHLTQYLPSFGYALMEPSFANGLVYLWYFPFKTYDVQNVPKMIFTPDDDFWYQFFKNEALALWEDSSPYIPANSQSTVIEPTMT